MFFPVDPLLVSIDSARGGDGKSPVARDDHVMHLLCMADEASDFGGCFEIDEPGSGNFIAAVEGESRIRR